MKAVLCKQFGPPESLVIEELPSPKAGAGEVVVSVKAASLNFPDVLIIQNKYQFKPPLPFSPGSEMSGVVKEVGEGVKGYKPGDRVIAFTTYGAFAEEVKVEASRLVPIPEGMDFNSAAAFLLTYGTSDHALRDRGALKAGETLLVLGAAGGVGLAAIEIGKAMGATVIACASSADKLEVCKQHGADAGINYATGALSVDTGSAAAAATVVLNDPNGRFGRAQTPDSRFSVDDANPTVHGGTGYPMCVPRTDPAVTDDLLCPRANRPNLVPVTVNGVDLPAVAGGCLNFSVAGIAPPVAWRHLRPVARCTPTASQAAVNVEPPAINPQNRGCLSISSCLDDMHNTSDQNGVATTD